MKYYAIVTDKHIFKDFICREKEFCALIAFEENDKQAVYGLFSAQFFKQHPQYKQGDNILGQYRAAIVDEEGCIYALSLKDGAYSHCGNTGLKKFIRSFYKLNADLESAARKTDSVKRKYVRPTIERRTSFISGYKKFSYFDPSGAEIPFRLRAGKGEGKMPLLIYLHGASAMGNDNFKQLAEYGTAGINPGKNCLVLLPQCGNFALEEVENINVYTAALGGLVKLLAKSYPVDEKRIYVTGISYGGACTWYSVYNNPNFYAAAIPLMGYMPDAYSDIFRAQAFSDVKIWAGHAADDKVVPPDSDLNIYGKIKDICDIKFSLYQKGGHKMMRKFYRKEKWREWLFSQQRK